MNLQQINDYLIRATLIIFGIVLVGSLFSLVVPQAALSIAVALYALLLLTAVTFVLSFYLLVQYISKLMDTILAGARIDVYDYENEEVDENERDTTESIQEGNEGNDRNAESNGDSRQEEKAEQDELQRLQTRYTKAGRVTTGQHE